MFCMGLESTGLGGIGPGAPHELFLPEARAEAKKELKTADINSYIRSIQKEYMTANGVFTTKIMWRHFRELLIELRNAHPAKEMGDLELLNSAFGVIRFIHLKRLNKTDQAISLSRARQSGIWHKTSESEKELKMRERKVRFKFLEIMHYESSLTVGDDCWQRFFKKSNIEPMTIIYEELVDDFRGKIFEVTRSLDPRIEREEVTPKAEIKKLSDSCSKEWANKFLRKKKAHRWLKPLSVVLVRLNDLFRLYRLKKIFAKD